MQEEIDMTTRELLTQAREAIADYREDMSPEGYVDPAAPRRAPTNPRSPFARSER
jgi:hypothetical protein